MTPQHACCLHVATLMYMHVSYNMHGIGTFSMNVPCVLHECTMHVTCMSKKNGLHASIGNVHMQACVEHTCSSIYVCILW